MRLHLLLHLLQGGMEVHLPVLLIQAHHELHQLRLGAIVPDLFLLMLAVLLAGQVRTERVLKLTSFNWDNTYIFTVSNKDILTQSSE